MPADTARSARAGRVLTIWTPEDKAFWEQQGRAIANINLWVSVPCLFLAFAVWQLWSVVAVNLPALGFKFTANELFWLAAAPGLSGATLQRLLSDVRRGLVEPDCRLLAAMLYYIESFPERQHHPKEDQHLFKALRARTREGAAALDELQGEHIRSSQMMAYLAQTLVRYQGGAPDGLHSFAAAVDAYAALLGVHMRKEETVVLPLADAHLKESDWDAIAAAFAENRDPLFGEDAGQEMRRLRRRIANLVPRKLQSLLRPEGAE